MMSRSAGPATWRLVLDPCRPDVTPAMQCWTPGLPSQPGISACSRLSGLDELTLSGEKVTDTHFMLNDVDAFYRFLCGAPAGLG